MTDRFTEPSDTPGTPTRPEPGEVACPPAGADEPAGARDHRAPHGWWPVIVIISVALVDRLESSVLPAILEDLQGEWGFSDTAGGSLSAAISIMGALLALPAGYLADRANRKNLLAVVVALWSVITLGSAVAVSFAMFYATRLALAAADSIDNPSQVSLLSDYYSVEVRPKVLGFHRMMWFAGISLGMIYGGVVGQLLGWRAVFYIILVPGLLVAWWCYRLHEPRRGEADARAAIRAGERATAPHAEAEVAADGAPSARQPDQAAFDAVDLTQQRGLAAFAAQLRTIARIPTVVLVYSGLAGLFFGLNGIFFWLPTFYRRDFGLEGGPAGILTAVIIFVGVCGGTWIGGNLGERWHGVVDGGRVLAGAGGILAGTLALPVAIASRTLAWQAIAMVGAVTLLSVAIPTLMAAIADSLPANQRGVGFSLLGVFITFGAFGPLLVGALSDATDSLRFAFAVLLAPMLVGGAVTMLGKRTYERDAQRALDTVVDAARGTSTDPAPREPGDVDLGS